MALNPPLSVPGYDVEGRVFIITGGTQGLGLGIAQQLEKQGAAGLVVVSRNEEKGEAVSKELTTISCTCRFIKADLSDASQVQSVVPQAIELMKKKGPISGLVNAAAITARGNLFTTTPEGFDIQMAINVRAPMLLTQAVAKHMIDSKTKGGSVVNISSAAAHGGAPFILAYSASKAALNCVTVNNAAELASHGIRVNAINMGWTVTDNESKLQTAAMGKDWIAQADTGVPLGRILRPPDVASTVGFLLSNSSAMMTGNCINLHPEYPHGMLSLLTEDKR